MNNEITFYSDTAEGWERALYAFLAEKERLDWALRVPQPPGVLRCARHTGARSGLISGVLQRVMARLKP